MHKVVDGIEMIFDLIDEEETNEIKIKEEQFLTENETNKKPIKKQKKYICESCGHQCNTHSALFSHKKIHDINSRKHACPECGKKFKTQSEVKRHLKTHSGEKNFFCPIQNCGRSFTSKQYLQKHIELHKTQQSYRCTFKNCGQAYFMKSELIAHVKEKHNEMNINKNGAFCCPHENCKRVFEFPSLLLKHCTSQHSKNEIICCFDNCHVSFDREELFYNHILSVHNMTKEMFLNEQIECPTCGLIVMKCVLNDHILKSHTIQNDTLNVNTQQKWFNCN